jgi:uncharacterized protein
MDVTPLVRQGQQIIQSYAGGQFKVSGKVYQGSVIVTPDQTFSWESPGGIEGLKATDFDILGAGNAKPDIILLGTGKNMAIPPPELRNSLKNKGLTIDFMDTGAACRTYNVLMAEGRRIAALLLPA